MQSQKCIHFDRFPDIRSAIPRCMLLHKKSLRCTRKWPDSQGCFWAPDLEHNRCRAPACVSNGQKVKDSVHHISKNRAWYESKSFSKIGPPWPEIVTGEKTDLTHSCVAVAVWTITTWRSVYDAIDGPVVHLSARHIQRTAERHTDACAQKQQLESAQKKSQAGARSCQTERRQIVSISKCVILFRFCQRKDRM